MLIKIEELAVVGAGRFLIRVNIDDSEDFDIELQNPHTPDVEKAFEWYFEHYIQEPSTIETKVARAKQQLAIYGENLFEQLFGQSEIFSWYKRGLDSGGFGSMSIEILGGKESYEFHRILWEALRDPMFKEALAVKGATFNRRSRIASPLLAQVNEHYEINLLMVTARPSGEHDVNHRTIQGPLIDLIRRSPRLRVNAQILRPGTFMALKEELQKNGAGYFHIVHFDMHGAVLDFDTLKKGRGSGFYHFSSSTLGKPRHSFQERAGRDDLESFEGKRAFLFFESGQKGCAEPTSAEEVGNLIQQFRVPLCVLNACQSAKQDDDSNETNLAKLLHEQAGNLVLAMRYSVSVTGATLLMQKLYEQLLDGRTIDESISFARQHLADHKNRDAALGYQIELEDWVLPTTYKYQNVNLALREMTDDERASRARGIERQYRAPKRTFGFHGRDLDIMEIERLLIKQNHLLVRGMLGVGKTTLLQYLAEWWSYTAFRGASNAVYFDIASNVPTLAKLVDGIGEIIFEKCEWNGHKRDELVVRKRTVLDRLNSNPTALVIDGVWSLDSEDVLDFLSQLEGQSFAIYASVGDEPLLQSRVGAGQYWLDGLNRDGAFSLASEILKKHERDIRDLVKDSKSDLERLLEGLGGNPSAMMEVLPSLSCMSLDTVLSSFQEGTVLKK